MTMSLHNTFSLVFICTTMQQLECYLAKSVWSIRELDKDNNLFKWFNDNYM